jgi:hypothetical protein
MGQTVQTFINYQGFINMSFIGTLIGGYAAKQIGAYNNALYQTQAQIKLNQAQIKRNTYLNIERPRIVENFARDRSIQLVSWLNSGAEMRLGDTPHMAMVDNAINQAFDLEILDYNSTVEQQFEIANASLLQSRGRVEQFRGDTAFRASLFKSAGQAYGNYQESGSILG